MSQTMISQSSAVSSSSTTMTAQQQPTRPYQLLSRETSFVSIPVSSPMNTSTGSEGIDAQSPKSITNKIIKKEDSPTGKSSPIQISGITKLPEQPTEPPPYPQQTKKVNPPLHVVINKEMLMTQNVAQMTPVEIKKEFLDDNSQQSIFSDNGNKCETPLTTPKEEFLESAGDAEMKNMQESAQELKKRKRREYQKNRRQMQINQNKESQTNNKKKSRKFSKIDEDYDTFIDNLMVQLRQLPSMQILEPLLSRNFGVCPVYGSGEIFKIGAIKEEFIDPQEDVSGSFGKAEILNVIDFYNTSISGRKQANADVPVVPIDTSQSSSTQRGFYDQEFQPIKFENDDDNKYRYDYSMKDRTDVDTPDTVISSSSPECVWEGPLSFPGLRLIKEEDSAAEDEDLMIYSRMSPQIPIVVPVPIRLKTGINLSIDSQKGANKENEDVNKDNKLK